MIFSDDKKPVFISLVCLFIMYSIHTTVDLSIGLQHSQ